MNWKNQVNKAVDSLKDVAESETVRNIVSKAKETTKKLTQKAKEGAMGAAEAFVAANADPSALKLHHLNADVTIVSPSDGIEITRPAGGTLVISDGSENGVIINAATDQAYVTETIGTVTRLNANTYDIGAEDGINVVVVKM